MTPSNVEKPAVKVMVVDDDPLIHLIFKRVAAKTGIPMQIEGVLQPVAGLEMVSSFDPDLVFIDVNMPQMSGWQFLEALGESTKNRKLFMFTSSIDPSDRERALGYPAVREYLVKPITAEQLGRLI